MYYFKAGEYVKKERIQHRETVKTFLWKSVSPWKGNFEHESGTKGSSSLRVRRKSSKPGDFMGVLRMSTKGLGQYFGRQLLFLLKSPTDHKNRVKGTSVPQAEIAIRRRVCGHLLVAAATS